MNTQTLPDQIDIHCEVPLVDLSGSPEIRASDILEAIQYRSLDRKLFS